MEGPDKLEDMDECRIYEGNICQHICVNTQGSFRCECFPGYVLQEDTFTCAPGNEADHRLRSAPRRRGGGVGGVGRADTSPRRQGKKGTLRRLLFEKSDVRGPHSSREGQPAPNPPTLVAICLRVDGASFSWLL